MASRAKWRFGIFAIGLQMAIKLNQVKSIEIDAYSARTWDAIANYQQQYIGGFEVVRTISNEAATRYSDYV